MRRYGLTCPKCGERENIFSDLSESDKKECVEDCLNFFLADFSSIDEALAYAHADSINEIEERIYYLLK